MVNAKLGATWREREKKTLKEQEFLVIPREN